MALKLAGLDPEIREYAEACLASARRFGLHVTITSVRRTWAFQQELRDHWLQCVASGHAYDPDPSLKCRYPANAPGDSAHNFGLAWDSTVEDGEWEAWKYIREWHGWRVPENDRVHAEVKDWRKFALTWTAPIG